MDFDSQASEFDARAGLSAVDLTQIAQAVLRMAELGRSEVLLEIGAGTGEIGAHLLSGARYLGLDASREMLHVFWARSPDALLLLADANEPWPIASHSVRCVFMSRVAHLLHRDTLLSELERVAHPDGLVVVIGRRRRDSQSLQRILQRELHALIEGEGLTPRRGERDSQRLLEVLVERGAEPLSPLDACAFQVSRSPADFLGSWASKPGLTGLTLSEPLKRRILAALELWARERFDDLQEPVAGRETYTLTGVKLRP